MFLFHVLFLLVVGPLAALLSVAALLGVLLLVVLLLVAAAFLVVTVPLARAATANVAEPAAASAPR